MVAIQGERDTPDEGAGAHLFCLPVAGQVPFVLVFLASADWARVSSILKMLLFQVLGLASAFSAVVIAEL